MEKHYAFIKNNVVENILVFAEQNDEFAQIICNEQGFDFFVWLADGVVPARFSSYDGAIFTEPTLEYLYEIGVNPVDPNAVKEIEPERKVANVADIDAKLSAQSKLSALGLTEEEITAII